MDLAKVLFELRQELADIDAAILSLERLETAEKRRVRGPQWLAEMREVAASRKRIKAEQHLKNVP
jgi:hypothetical protein